MQLETARLRIRPFILDDEAAAIAFFTDPDFMVWSLDGALSREGARSKLRDLIALYEERGFSKLILTEKASGCRIGYCGFGWEPIEGAPEPELGYRLLGSARGRGLATEAARAVIADAFTRVHMPFVRAIVEKANAPSRRVLGKLGLAYERRVLLRGRDLLLYQLDRQSRDRDVETRSGG